MNDRNILDLDIELLRNAAPLPSTRSDILELLNRRSPFGLRAIICELLGIERLEPRGKKAPEAPSVTQRRALLEAVGKFYDQRGDLDEYETAKLEVTLYREDAWDEHYEERTYGVSLNVEKPLGTL